MKRTQHEGESMRIIVIPLEDMLPFQKIIKEGIPLNIKYEL